MLRRALALACLSSATSSRPGADFDTASLMAILAEWAQATPYETCTANLQSGAGGVPILNAGTVFYGYPTGGSTLTGGADLDFFFGQAAVDTNDRAGDELFIEIA